MTLACLLVVLAACAAHGSRLQSATLQPVHELMGCPSAAKGLLLPQNVTAEGFVSHRYHATDEHGRRIHLEYTAQLAPETERNVLLLDHEPSLISATCVGESLVHVVLHKAHADHSRMQSYFTRGSEDKRPVFLTGGAQGHVARNCSTWTLMHRVTHVHHVRSDSNTTSILLDTSKAHLSHVFKHANVSFFRSRSDRTNSSKYKRDESTNAENYGSTEAFPSKVRRANVTDTETFAAHRLEWSFSSFCSSIWNGVKQLGSTVTTVAKTVYAAAKVLVTGNYQFQCTWSAYSWNWNYDSSHGGALRSQVQIDNYMACTNCYAEVDVDLSFILQIQSYSLQALEVVSSGEAAFNLEIDADLVRTYTNGSQIRIAEPDAGTISFALGGIPVVIHTKVPIDLGYQVDVSIQGHATAVASASGDVRYGFLYTPSRGFQQISDYSYQHSGGLQSISLNMQANLQLYLLATVVTDIEYIGGPTVGFKPFIEFSADYSSSSLCGRYGGFSVASNWGLQVTIGAKVNIALGSTTIYKHDFGSSTVFSIKKPLFSGCLFASTESEYHLDSVRHHVASDSDSEEVGGIGGCSDPFLPGTTWTGFAKRISTKAACQQYPSYKHLVLQIIEADFAGDLTLAGSENFGDDEYACVLQSTYLADYYSGSRDIILEPVTSRPTVQTYSYCTNDQQSQPYGYAGTVDAQLMAINVSDSMNCLNVYLTRTLPGGDLNPCSGAPPSPSPSPSPSPPPPPSGACCGNSPFGPSQCNLPSGASCYFGCQCQSGNCPGSTCQ